MRVSRSEAVRLPHLALSAHAHNRLGGARTDAAELDRRWADPTSRVLLVAGSRVRPDDGRVRWLAPAEVPALPEHVEGERILLGEYEGRTWFALRLDPADAPGAPEEWVGLRELFPVLADDDTEALATVPMLFHAIGIAEWRQATRFCPRCGADLVPRLGGHELECTRCGRRQFPRTDPAVIMAVTRGEPGAADERLLLGHQATWPEGRYSTLAGFLEPGETLEDAVRREVMEEVAVEVGEVRYFGNQPWPLPASLMVGFFARAESERIDVDGAEISHARWFTRSELRAAIDTGEMRIPRGVSISSSLIESWYGERLPGGW